MKNIRNVLGNEFASIIENKTQIIANRRKTIFMKTEIAITLGTF